MIEVKATIQNKAGIHCRPTAEIVKVVTEYDGVVTVVAKSGSCELGSALELLMLGLRFKKLFETNFDFPDAQVV